MAGTTIRRYHRADDAEADGVPAVIRRLGEPPEDFVTGDSVAGFRRPGVGGGSVRVDRDEVALADGDDRG